MGLAYENYPRRWRRRLCLYLVVVVVLIFGGGGLLFYRRIAGSSHPPRVYSTLSLKTMGQFPFDSHTGVDSDIPAQFRALDGKKVKLDGFMVTTNSAEPQLSVCQLVWRIGDSHGPPQVQERVFLHALPGQRITRYDATELVTVGGTLRVKVMKDSDGQVRSVFDMTVDEVTPTDRSNSR